MLRTCACQSCGRSLEFESYQSGTEVECPYCKSLTTLLTQRAHRYKPVKDYRLQLLGGFLVASGVGLIAMGGLLLYTAVQWGSVGEQRLPALWSEGIGALMVFPVLGTVLSAVLLALVGAIFIEIGRFITVRIACSNCMNTLASKTVRICPTCKVEFY